MYLGETAYESMTRYSTGLKCIPVSGLCDHDDIINVKIFLNQVNN
jgi:hypothetical protein